MSNTPSQRHRSIYVLPNLFTSASLLAAFFAIISAFNERFTTAVICILLSAILDALDGRVARLTNTQSAFGAEYDSLADVVAFGAAPALVAYFWQLKHAHPFGWVVAFAWLVCVALRLARFNTELPEASESHAPQRFFVGLPCPAAAVTLAGFIWFVRDSFLANHFGLTLFFSTFLTLYLAIMMVSNVPFRSFKDLDMRANLHYHHVVLLVLGLAIVMAQLSHSIFLIFLVYVLSGPISWYFKKDDSK